MIVSNNFKEINFTYAFVRFMIFLLCLCLIQTACGGGTTGTGGTGSSDIYGRISYSTGQNVSGAIITIFETGDSTVTDQNGDFLIESTIISESITLLVEVEDLSTTTSLDQIPAGPQNIDLELELNKAEKTVEVKKKQITGKETKPTPTALPESTQLPNPATATAIPLPIDEPTAEPTAIVPVASQTPSILPTATPNVTVTPTIQLKTVFKGTLVSSDPLLLIDAKIGIRDVNFKKIESDGSFQFTVPSSDLNNIVAVRVAGTSARVEILGITANTLRATLQLRIEKRSNGKLSLVAESARIVERPIT